MTMPSWKLSDLLLFVLACGIALAAYGSFGHPRPDPNAKLLLAAYLALMTTTSLGSFFAPPSWRRPSQGFALFGWYNLVFLMWGGSGFSLGNSYNAQRVADGCWIGMLFGVLCAIAAARLLEPPGGGQRPA